MAASCAMGSMPLMARAVGLNDISADLSKGAVKSGSYSELHHWHGFALGAEVSLQLYHHDAEAAGRIIRRSVEVVRDMEGLFSLYQENSALSKLNREGVLHHPAEAFVDLLQTAQHISRVTAGAFDVTVQPLWQYYHDLFSGRFVEKEAAEALQAVRKLVGYEKLHVSPEKISFEREGMAATLNGIAQGYVTDRVSDYLKSEGLTSVLVDMGEYRALGPQADKSPWKIGLADPENPGNLSDIIELSHGAIATSAPQGDRFDKKGEYHHLFDPHGGKSTHRYLSVTVMAPSATTADALSTAFSAMSVADIRKCLKNFSSVKVRLTDKAGTVIIA